MDITVLVLEDEEYTRKYLVKLTEQHPGVGEVWGVGTGAEAVDIAASRQPTLALLDVELGTGERHNGIQVAEEIARRSPLTKYVFITGYAKYALDSFVVHPYDYLLKPVDRNRLQNTLEAVINMVNESKPPEVKVPRTLSLRTKTGINLIPYDDIIFVESANRRTLIHTADKCYASYHSLQYYSKRLPSTIFLQVHKAFLVNKTKVSAIREVGNRTYQVHFQNSVKMAMMSRQYYIDYRHLLG